jgi:hypothetical protein
MVADRMPGHPLVQACSHWRTCVRATKPGHWALKRSQSCGAWRTHCAGSATIYSITVRINRRSPGWRTGEPGPSRPVSPIQRSTLYARVRAAMSAVLGSNLSEDSRSRYRSVLNSEWNYSEVG